MFKKALLIFISLLLMSSIAIAQSSLFPFTIKAQAINNLPNAGTPVLIGSEDQGLTWGPILEGSQTKLWAPELKDQLYALGWTLSDGEIEVCLDSSKHFVTLDPENYTSDTIIVTYNNIQSGTMNCTCTGSACTLSLFKQKGH